MKILIDFTELGGPNHSLEVYGERLITAIPMWQRKQITLLVPQNGIERAKELFPDLPCLVFNKQPAPHITRPLDVFLFPIRQWRYCRIVNRFDVLLVMSHSHAVTSCRTRCRKVTVVHDLTYTHIPHKSFEFLRARSWGRYFCHRHLLTSDAVVSISQYTKKHIAVEFPDIPQNKIHVVYNSVALPEEEKIPYNADQLGEFILYVNTLQEYKNIFTLLKAYNRLFTVTNKKLVVVGRETDYWREKMLPYIELQGMSEYIIRVSDISFEELRWLYSHALLFVTPSLHEGFGYTPIEAAICGCPVISSTCESLPDVTQGRVIYYEPATDDQKLAEKITEMLNNPLSQKHLDETASLFSRLYSPITQWSNIYHLLYGKKKSVFILCVLHFLCHLF